MIAWLLVIVLACALFWALWSTKAYRLECKRRVEHAEGVAAALERLCGSVGKERDFLRATLGASQTSLASVMAQRDKDCALAATATRLLDEEQQVTASFRTRLADIEAEEKRAEALRNQVNKQVNDMALLSNELTKALNDVETLTFRLVRTEEKLKVAEAGVIVHRARADDAESVLAKEKMRQVAPPFVASAPEGLLSSAALKDGVTASDCRSGLAILPKKAAKKRAKKP